MVTNERIEKRLKKSFILVSAIASAVALLGAVAMVIMSNLYSKTINKHAGESGNSDLIEISTQITALSWILVAIIVTVVVIAMFLSVRSGKMIAKSISIKLKLYARLLLHQWTHIERILQNRPHQLPLKKQLRMERQNINSMLQ